MRQKNERCVCCGNDTGIPVDLPISQRETFLVGCGQLCAACFAELAIEARAPENDIRVSELHRLFEITD